MVRRAGRPRGRRPYYARAQLLGAAFSVIKRRQSGDHSLKSRQRFSRGSLAVVIGATFLCAKPRVPNINRGAEPLSEDLNGAARRAVQPAANLETHQSAYRTA